MYNNNTLPTTGLITVGLGLTANQMVGLGVFCVVTGIIIFKLARFKSKESKK